MRHSSSLTIAESVKLVDEFLPVKITFNDMVLYDDYDVTDDYIGETLPPLSVIPERIQNYRRSIVESIQIDIVDFHHSIIRMYGKRVEE